MNGEPRNRMNEARLSYLSPLVRLVTVRLSSPFFRLVCSSPSEPEARMSGGTKERSERRSVAGTLVTTSVSLSSTRYIFASRVPASPFPPYRREK